MCQLCLDTYCVLSFPIIRFQGTDEPQEYVIAEPPYDNNIFGFSDRTPFVPGGVRPSPEDIKRRNKEVA